MKTSSPVRPSLVGLAAVGALLPFAALATFAACSSVEPIAAVHGDPPTEEVVDAGVDACVPLENSALRAEKCALGDGAMRECGTLSVEDNCGAVRSVDCGQCDPDAAAANVCNAATGRCECSDSRSDLQVLADSCAAQQLTCGEVTPSDRCGKARAAGSCGSCGDGATCTSNKCTCATAATTGLKFLCGKKCVRTCLEGCEAAPIDCQGEKNTCVAACSGNCDGKATKCTTFQLTTGRADLCFDLPDGGSCPLFSAPCTTAQNCGFTAQRKNAVCVIGDAGTGECFYCGAPGTNGQPCGAAGETCVAAARTCTAP